jgi:phage shock protein E
MRKLFFLSITFFALLLASCGGSYEKVSLSKEDVSSGKTVVVDVRSVDEWNNDGHADCALNIPLPELESHLDSLRKFEKVILVCRSGNRAGSAMHLLTEAGFKNVENHGSWKNIECTP